ncbi:hypothetical protein HK096_010388, partial [Nowakowskiella sp. JEL0078]
MTWKASGLFAMFGILEAPTLLLSIASINKNLRRDYLYGAMFFATRIVLHLVLLYRLFTDFPDRKLWVAPLCVFPLHIIWFNRWVQQQRREWTKSKSATYVAKVVSVSKLNAPSAEFSEQKSLENSIKAISENVNSEFAEVAEERLPLPTSPTRRILAAVNRVRRFMKNHREGLVGHSKRQANDSSYILTSAVAGKRARLSTNEFEKSEKEKVERIEGMRRIR